MPGCLRWPGVSDAMRVSTVAYILKAFPRTSETFISNEIALLEELGLRLRIFSMKRLESQQIHGAVGRIRSEVTYLPEATDLGEVPFRQWFAANLPRFVPSHRRLMRRVPVRYARTLLESLVFCVVHRKVAFFKQFLQAGAIALEVSDAKHIAHLHAHFAHGVTTVAMFVSSLTGIPFSFTAHAKDIYQTSLNPGRMLQRKIRRARFVATCTRTNDAYLRNASPDGPIVTIYHGLDTALFTRSSSDANTPSATRPVVLSAGRHVEKKGFTDLLAACRLLKNRGYDLECRIVGGTDAFTPTIVDRIRTLDLHDSVVLMPAVPQEQLRGVYQQATVFALPCRVIENGDRDGIPNVLAEAMAMELPVVATRISGIPELVTTDVNGLLVPQRDPIALANAIERLLCDAQLRDRLGKEARSTICRDFDAKQTILLLHELFLKQLASVVDSRTATASDTPRGLSGNATPNDYAH